MLSKKPQSKSTSQSKKLQKKEKAQKPRLSSVMAQNIKHLMVKHRLDTALLSAKTGIAPSTINSLRRGNGNPTLHTLNELAKFFSVTIHSLIEKDLQNIDRVNYSHEIPLISINELGTFLSDQTSHKKTLSVELPLNTDPQKFFGIKIENSSFSPIFSQNTIFVVFNDDKSNDGDIVLVKFGNSPACFRQIFIEGNAYSFKNIANDCNKNAAKSSDFCILGVVIKAIQTFCENIYR